MAAAKCEAGSPPATQRPSERAACREGRAATGGPGPAAAAPPFRGAAPGRAHKRRGAAVASGGGMQAGPGVQAVRPFKLRKSLGMGQCGAAERGGGRCARNACALFRAATRREEVAGIRAKFPTKIPVIRCSAGGGSRLLP